MSNQRRNELSVRLICAHCGRVYFDCIPPKSVTPADSLGPYRMVGAFCLPMRLVRAVSAGRTANRGSRLALACRSMLGRFPQRVRQVPRLVLILSSRFAMCRMVVAHAG